MTPKLKYPGRAENSQGYIAQIAAAGSLYTHRCQDADDAVEYHAYGQRYRQHQVVDGNKYKSYMRQCEGEASRKSVQRYTIQKGDHGKINQRHTDEVNDLIGWIAVAERVLVQPVPEWSHIIPFL